MDRQIRIIFCGLLGIHPRGQRKYRGRGSLQELRQKPEAQGAHFVSSRDPVAHWWPTVSFILADLTGHLKDRTSRRFERLLERLRDLSTTIPVSTLMPLVPKVRSKWTRAVRVIGELANQSIESLSEQAYQNSVRAQRAALNAG